MTEPATPTAEAVAMDETVVHAYEIPGVGSKLCIGTPPWRPKHLGWCLWMEVVHPSGGKVAKVLAEFDTKELAQAAVLYLDAQIQFASRAIEAARAEARTAIEAAARRTYPY